MLWCVRYMPNTAVSCGCWGHLGAAPQQLWCSSRALGEAGGFQIQQADPDLSGELSGSSSTWILGFILGWGYWHLSEYTTLHWWGDGFDGCTRAIRIILAPLVFRLPVHRQNTTLCTLDNLLPDVLGSKHKLHPGEPSAGPGAQLSSLPLKQGQVVLKQPWGSASDCSANTNPKSWFATCLGAFTLPCLPLPSSFLLCILSPDGAVGSSIMREEEKSLAFK